ncbi:MAG: urea ABC transporter permease subunit UrtB [Casimicrobiaceae bacterium]|nr:urea ABC transporter permease subunit UrtB [Casimicrobiaceae bacterium]
MLPISAFGSHGKTKGKPSERVAPRLGRGLLGTLGQFTRRAIFLLLASLCLPTLVFAQGLSAELARKLATGESEERIEALRSAMARPSPELERLIRALLEGQVRLEGAQVVIVSGDTANDALTGTAVKLSPNAEEPVINNRLRRAFQEALAALGLLSPDANTRRQALSELAAASDRSYLPLIERALAQETDGSLRERLEELRATLQISAEDRALRLQAVAALADRADPKVRSLLQARLAADGEEDPEVRRALAQALKAVETRLAWGEWLGVLFSGLSLGSILLLAALGLAITYGQMGVINMAHGELLMIGAYATYLTQNLFRSWLPEAFDFYILAAIPVSFLAAAGVGAVLERSVLRYLYGRPLETLLATWGISLILIQAVRSIFGAQNVQVENPSWLSGGLPVLSNLTLPYNRVALIVFALIVLALVYLILTRSRLGLFIRGVTQNRPIAACMGVNTARIDTAAFALGSGIAGLGGCALSQIGNVGPDLGQTYIIDSFMVVVLGGVGQLLGTVYAAAGLGLVNKLLEGWTGAVLAKITVLVIIVLFIQRRPQGLFALKGRAAEG